MFCSSLFFVACFLGSVPYLRSTEQKVVTDIDLQTCVANFDVHTDKIIRTQDSRNMGARYLNEMDLDSREQCLRLCCETENCDVFVFEEKSTGSCYLFECGPPEDFKCKFTHHVNYTSAVLAVSRHMSNLESQIKLTKHEKDLTKLRTPEIHTIHDLKKQNSYQTTQPPTTTTTQPKKLIAATSKESPSNKEKERKCSRYQFECKSSGECIAIYNACDGITQCADGSDEGPELNCPELRTTIKPHFAIPVASSEVRYVSGNNRPNADHQDPQQYPQSYKPSFPKQLPSVPHGQDFNSEGDFLRPLPNVRNPDHQVPSPYENQQLPYPNAPIENSNDWISHASNAASVGRNSRIFNHVENGIQGPQEQESSQTRYREADSRNYNPHFYGETYQNAAEYRPQSWPNVQQGNTKQVYDKNAYESEAKAKSEVSNSGWQNQRQTISEGHNVGVDQITSPLHAVEPHDPQESEKLTHDLKTSKHTMKGNKPKEPPKEKQPKLESEHAIKVEKDYVEVADLREFDDGFAQTPGGAALSLTLGLFITCIMAILIACRLRVVRRRIRKGGKGYAHDADYLVNGMYL